MDKNMDKMRRDWHNQGIAALRRAFLRSPQRNEAKRRAKIAYGLYQCEICCHIGGPKEFDVDHIYPMQLTLDWNEIMKRFWDLDNLSLICKPCHKDKTKYDRELMRQQRLDNPEQSLK